MASDLLRQDCRPLQRENRNWISHIPGVHPRWAESVRPRFALPRAVGRWAKEVLEVGGRCASGVEFPLLRFANNLPVSVPFEVPQLAQRLAEHILHLGQPTGGAPSPGLWIRPCGYGISRPAPSCVVSRDTTAGSPASSGADSRSRARPGQRQGRSSWPLGARASIRAPRPASATLAKRAANAPSVPVHRIAGLQVLSSNAVAQIRLGHVAAEAHGFESTRLDWCDSPCRR